MTGILPEAKNAVVTPGETESACKLVTPGVTLFNMTHPLRQYREKIGLSAEAFAKLVPTSRQTIHRIETGKQKPSLPLVRRFMDLTHGSVTGVDLRPDLFSADVVQSFSRAVRRGRSSNEIAA